LHDRPEAKYLVVRAKDDATNTNIIAVRCTVASKLQQIKFLRLTDGTYKTKTNPRVCAHSRIQVASVLWRHPVCSHSDMVVVNAHFHHRAAKRDTGFRLGYTQFFNKLATTIKENTGRLLAGDFNMSLWVVATELRNRGIECTMGAWYAWRDMSGTVKVDSCGIFFCGPIENVRVILGPSIFGNGDDTELEQLHAGQGYQLKSYVPQKDEDCVQKVHQTFNTRGNGGPGTSKKGSVDMDTDSWQQLPVWQEKRANMNFFDPHGELFRGGAHMPLFGFLGS
jgi:hypothetical protein